MYVLAVPTTPGPTPCATCRTALRPGDRFCWTCGTPLTATDPAPGTARPATGPSPRQTRPTTVRTAAPDRLEVVRTPSHRRSTGVRGGGADTPSSREVLRLVLPLASVLLIALGVALWWLLRPADAATPRPVGTTSVGAVGPEAGGRAVTGAVPAVL